MFRPALVVAAAGAGFLVTFVACCFARVGHPFDLPNPPITYKPMPHHVPKTRDGVAFRFAMAHDIIHERYPRHGDAHFRERERLVRDKLQRLKPDDAAAFAATDDLAAALDRLGRSAEAVALLRDKLKRQRAKGIAGGDLYTTNSNLGTTLVHDSFRRWLAGDAGAKASFREGAEFIRKSVEVYPQAHFGRQQWEAALAEFLAVAMDDPSVLAKFDFVGDRLDQGVEQLLNQNEQNVDDVLFDNMQLAHGRAYNPNFVIIGMYVPPADSRLDDPARWADFLRLRDGISRIGAEHNWKLVDVPSHREPVPFDEPALGIVSMWRQTSGPSPHLALALGEIMLRVGQRYIAWAAFERAARLADQFWPDEKIQKALRDHCRRRQEEIEGTLRFHGELRSHRAPWQEISPPPAEEVVSGLRAQFDAELAKGESYQKAYQEYEAKKLAAGASIDDEHLFDEFNAGREPIASPSGPEEWYAAISQSEILTSIVRASAAWAVVGAGAAAMAMALILRWRASSRKADV